MVENRSKTGGNWLPPVFDPTLLDRLRTATATDEDQSHQFGCSPSNLGQPLDRLQSTVAPFWGGSKTGPSYTKCPSDMIKKSSLNQSVLNGHLHERPTTERVMPYSDQLFREVATEWLILTDQVC